MRRKDREITDRETIQETILSCHCLRLGFYDGNEVYILPLHFGYAEKNGEQIFYFHGSPQGRKIELIKRFPSVGFEMDTGYMLLEGDSPCSYSACYKSIIGTGHVFLIENPEEKRVALLSIMQHCTGKKDWDIPDNLEHVCAFCLKVSSLSCKIHERPGSESNKK